MPTDNPVIVLVFNVVIAIAIVVLVLGGPAFILDRWFMDGAGRGKWPWNPK